MDMVPHLLMTPTESHMTALVMRRQGTGVLQRMPCHDLYSPGGMIATGAAILCYIRMQKGCALYAQQDVPVHYLDSKTIYDLSLGMLVVTLLWAHTADAD